MVSASPLLSLYPSIPRCLAIFPSLSIPLSCALPLSLALSLSPKLFARPAGPSGRNSEGGMIRLETLVELSELILSLKLDNQFPIEQFEATVSQSTVPSPPLRNVNRLRLAARRLAEGTTQITTTMRVPSFFCSRSRTTSEVVVRRASGLYFQ